MTGWLLEDQLKKPHISWGSSALCQMGVGVSPASWELEQEEEDEKLWSPYQALKPICSRQLLKDHRKPQECYSASSSEILSSDPSLQVVRLFD